MLLAVTFCTYDGTICVAFCEVDADVICKACQTNLLDQIKACVAVLIDGMCVGSSINQGFNRLSYPITTSIVQGGVLLILCRLDVCGGLYESVENVLPVVSCCVMQCCTAESIWLIHVFANGYEILCSFQIPLPEHVQKMLAKPIVTAPMFYEMTMAGNPTCLHIRTD